MDRLGFGDPPPNPYADLPVATSAEIRKKPAPVRRRRQGGPPPTASEIGPSGIPMREGLMRLHAWELKSATRKDQPRHKSDPTNTSRLRIPGPIPQIAEINVKGSPGADARDVCVEDLQTARGHKNRVRDDGPRTSPGTTTIGVFPRLCLTI